MANKERLIRTDRLADMSELGLEAAANEAIRDGSYVELIQFHGEAQRRLLVARDLVQRLVGKLLELDPEGGEDGERS